MQFEQVQFLQSLRGAQALVLLAYLIVRRAMTVDDLRCVTGLSDDALRPALKCLAGKGLLLKQTGQHGRVVWLPVGDTFFGRVFQNPVKPDSGALISSSSSQMVRVSSYREEEQEEAQNPVFADSGVARPGVVAALISAGIAEPKRSSLARLDHVTAEFVAAHVEQGKRDGVKIGTVIYRIEHAWQVKGCIVRDRDRLAEKIERLRRMSKDGEE